MPLKKGSPRPSWVSAARAAGVGAAGMASGGLVPALIGAGSSLVSSIWSARRADTAHQREVADLRRAGINPIATGAGRGAEIGEAPDLARGVSSALDVQRQRAEIELLQAQADQASSAAQFQRVQSADMQTTAEGRYGELWARWRKGDLEADQLEKMMPEILARAKEEVGLTKNSARAAAARAALDEAAERGALNREEFERAVGEMGPWVRFLLEVLRGVRGR